MPSNYEKGFGLNSIGEKCPIEFLKILLNNLKVMYNFGGRWSPIDVSIF